MRRAAALAIAVMVVAVAPAPARDGERRPDSITGVVLGPNGKPVANVTVRASVVGSSQEANSVATDDDGKFELSGLRAAPYAVGVEAADLIEDGDAGRSYVRLGESVTIRLAKGGVVTGKVTDAAGAPVVAVDVRAVRVKDGAGRRTGDGDWARHDVTDDRGVYRIYGLSVGSYLVVAGRVGSHEWSRVSSRDHDVPTYYPSSTRETAAPVVVSAGQEVGGIDIAYRGEVGHAIRGRLVGPGIGSDGGWCRVLVSRSGQDDTVAEWLGQTSENHEFSVEGVPDGDYEVRGSRYQDSKASFSEARRVFVRGADVAGVALELVPESKVSGTVVFERAGAADACKRARTGEIVETVVSAIRSDIRRAVTTSLPASLDDSGAFEILHVRPATYRFSTDLPDTGWYVRAITRGSGEKDAKSVRVDLARDGLAVGPGQSPADVMFVVAEGAASLAGTVQSATSDARVYLVPAEVASAADGARYYETFARADGAFAFRNVAPGAYRALVRVEPTAADGLPPWPAYWDVAGRAKLLKEAASRGTPVDLARCQDRKDLDLPTPAAPGAR